MKFVLLVVLFAFALRSSFAQMPQTSQVGIRRAVKIDKNTRFIDKVTGKPISYSAYQELMTKDPFGYHLEPIIDEYGQPSAYSIRACTPEERTTHSFNDIDITLRPKIGEPMQEFIMKGIDGKVYRLSELKGQVVVLSFWVSLQKPFWGPNDAKRFADALRPFQSENAPIILGILQDSKEEIASVMATETLPFMPIPDSLGFNSKFQVTSIPSFIIIDRSGKVANYIEGSDYDQLQKALQTVAR
ncbi:TlpA family protein disulfide reductase [Spirosoma foliorum]|uniref:TlpA family protein disulfide reductase n=1 Tax=Spirosoma foliorum TaxID=2710596 RepID=A0A7G5H2B4_9BACT|nr:redoxin domain-containing protein [Spirosoma foliorum]QMW05256.1 TlpA family protein disulfide reductase [Spirosoma foliorum]